MKKILLCANFILCICGLARASVIIDGPVTDPDSFWTLTITDSVSLDMTGTNLGTPHPSGIILVFQGMAEPQDGSQTIVPTIFPPIQYSVNGSSSGAPGDFVDNLSFNLGAISPNDSYIYLFSEIIDAGSTVTFPAGTYLFLGDPGMNPNIVGTFDGPMFLTDTDGNLISTVVPEPSSPFLMLLGAGGLLRRRRLRQEKSSPRPVREAI